MFKKFFVFAVLLSVFIGYAGAQEPVEEETKLPVLAMLAETFEVPYEELLALYEDGYGAGEIAHAYLIAQSTDLDAAAILEQYDSGIGWGEIILTTPDLHPGDFNPGSVLGHSNSASGEQIQNREGQGGGGKNN